MKKKPVTTAQERHSQMIEDPYRTPVLENAISKIVKRGDIVFDLGCGLGLLSQAALKAGAKRVYACDIDKTALEVAIQSAKKRNLLDRITFFHDLSSNVYLPEKVDVILSETVGSLGLDENIVPFVIDARDRFLKKDGIILPAAMTIWAAPVGELGSKKKSGWTIETIDPKQLLSPPKKYASLVFQKVKSPYFDKEIIFEMKEDSLLQGFAVWFDVQWCHETKDENTYTTSTSPWYPATHWKQGVLWNKTDKKLKKNQKLLFRLIIEPQGDFFDTQSTIEWGFSPTEPRI